MAAITSPMLMVIRRICLPWSARLCGLGDLDSLEAKLTHLRANGATSINILDAGCGPSLRAPMRFAECSHSILLLRLSP